MGLFTSDLFIYLSLGAFAGTLAGLLGVGGGLVIVPILAYVFVNQQNSPAIIMHLAIGTSLATIVVTSISSIYAHHKRVAVLWPLFWQLSPGIVAGTFLGALFATAIASQNLKVIFAIFELVVAAQMAFSIMPSAHRQLPARWLVNLAGSAIGFVSAIVGIGGGTLTVPYLSWCNIRIHQAIATSAACGLPIAISGALSYMFLGLGDALLPQSSVGFVHIPSLLGITLSSVLFAPLGAKMAHAMPVRQLKMVFAGFLFILGGSMLTL